MSDIGPLYNGAPLHSSVSIFVYVSIISISLRLPIDDDRYTALFPGHNERLLCSPLLTEKRNNLVYIFHHNKDMDCTWYLRIPSLDNTSNTLKPRQDDRHVPKDIFKCIFLNENVWISLKISLTFVRINNIRAMVEIMAWRRPDHKSLPG